MTLKPEDLIDFVAQRVAPYKKIREVAFIPEVPKNFSGKILRRVLKGG
jgi:acyl-coenzyme A synthetase/AMP-(fatty) acid ligase